MGKVLYGDVLGPEDEAKSSETVRKRFWKTLRKALTYVPFAEDVVAAYYCALDPATPKRVRLTLLGALAYFVLPLDALPDILAVVGFTDDVTVLAATIAMVRAHLKPIHYAAARDALSGQA